MTRRIVALVALFAIGGIGFTMTTSRYYVRDKLSGSEIFWSANRCFVVVGMARYGLRTNFLGSLAERFKAWLRVPGHRPTEQSSSIDILTITSTAVDAKRSSVPYSNFTLMNGDLYSRLDGYGQALWRWNGQSFEKATSEQEAALSHAQPPAEYSDRD